MSSAIRERKLMKPMLYQSLPLHEDGLCVRLLDILPGRAEDLIECSLLVKQLTGATSFEALSYTWGTPTQTKTIQINGTFTQVTPNLASALRHLRKTSQKRRIWVDALCIDQHNYVERATQVMKMGQIYRNAHQVLVWLGDPGPNTDLAFKYIRWCLQTSKNERTFQNAAMVCCPLHFYDLLWSNNQPHKYETCMSGFECPNCGVNCQCDTCGRIQHNVSEGLSDLLVRTWWQRIWVVQEVAMAAGDPLVGCGESWLSWSDFVKYQKSGEWWPGEHEAIVQLHRVRLDIKMPPRLRHTASPLPYSTEAAATDDIFHWLRRTVKFRATDPRDKIFALLGMARSKAWRDFRPDYSKSLEELMYSLVLRMICTDGNLDILTLCRPTLEPYRPNGPTWVPDFQLQGLPYLATMGHLPNSSPLKSVVDRLSAHEDSTSANITTRTADARCNDSYLSASGFVVDRVGDFTTEHTALLPDRDISKAVLELIGHKHGVGADIMSLQSLYYWYPIWRALDPACWQVDDDPRAAAFIQGLSTYFKLLHFRPKAWQSLEYHYDAEARLKYDSIVEKTRENLIKSPPRSEGIDRAMEGRCYFVTRSGLLGVGPENIRAEDKIVLLNGSSAAFALRTYKSPTSDQKVYALVGNVFVDAPPIDLPWLKPIPRSSWVVEDVQTDSFDIY